MNNQKYYQNENANFQCMFNGNLGVAFTEEEIKNMERDPKYANQILTERMFMESTPPYDEEECIEDTNNEQFEEWSKASLIRNRQNIRTPLTTIRATTTTNNMLQNKYAMDEVEDDVYEYPEEYSMPSTSQITKPIPNKLLKNIKKEKVFTKKPPTKKPPMKKPSIDSTIKATNDDEAEDYVGTLYIPDEPFILLLQVYERG
jgi:hypothetical protein